MKIGVPAESGRFTVYSNKLRVESYDEKKKNEDLVDFDALALCISAHMCECECRSCICTMSGLSHPPHKKTRN